MLIKKYLQIIDLFMIQNMYLMANITVFFFPIWLIYPSIRSVTIYWSILAALSIWILILKNEIIEFLNIMRKNWIIFPFLILSGISISWSGDWKISLNRWVVLLCTIIAGGYIGIQNDIKSILKLLSSFGAFILGLSIVLVIFTPDIGVMNYYSIQGAWKGLFWHKNHMGLIAAFFNILYLINIISGWQVRGKQLILWTMLYLGSIIIIYYSDSVSAYIVTMALHAIILFGVILLRLKVKIRRSHYVTIFIIMLISAVFVFINADQLLSLFNRNTTLTGRIPMWNYLFNSYISKKPTFGYGFNSFWYDPIHQVALQHAADYPDPIIISDNGFIDILVNTGGLGLIFFLMIFFYACWQAIQKARRAKAIDDLFPIILMSFILIANATWSLLYENESFFLLNMLTVLFSITANDLTKRTQDKKIPYADLSNS